MQIPTSIYKTDNLNKISRLSQCQFPGCKIRYCTTVIQKVTIRNKTLHRVYGISLNYLSQLHVNLHNGISGDLE